MKRVRSDLITTFTVTVFLISLIFFSAIYLIIGTNIDYMSKTQNQINDEIENLIAGNPQVEELNQGNIQQVLEKARYYNVGVEIIDSEGKQHTQTIDNNIRVWRLEIGGYLVTKQVSFNNGKEQAKLTYFRPFPAGDNTVKFFPAFGRLAIIFLLFASVCSWLLALIAAGSIKSDLKKVRAITSNLVKGSSSDVNKRANYLEINTILEELSALRKVVLNKEKLKKRMTADFAHELRTPLTTLQSHLEALIDGVWQPTTERFVSCHEEILRLIRLVGDLERLSKFEDENIILDKSSFDITELAKSICRNFEGELSHKNIALNFTGSKQEVYADKDKVSQVIVNLISNSFKYTPVNGKILMNISGDRDHVYLVINDSGVGIPTKDISNVFNRLYRSDASRTRATGGAGIGLTIAKSIIEAHRGSIDIVSQEGLGTELTMILPKRQ